MILTLILWVIGLIVIYRLLVLLFWICARLGLQPLRLVLWALVRLEGAIRRHLPTSRASHDESPKARGFVERLNSGNVDTSVGAATLDAP